MVAKLLVDPYGQRTTSADGARPSKSVASSDKSRVGSARDKLRERQGEMGAWEDGRKRKQRKHLARCLPLSQCKHTRSSSGSSDSALAVNLTTKFAEKAMVEPFETADPLAT